jgi:hypothetical protein
MLYLLPRPALTVLLPVVRADCGIGLAAFRGEIALTPQHELAYSRSLLHQSLGPAQWKFTTSRIWATPWRPLRLLRL